MCAPSRNSAFYQDFLQLEEQANPEGMTYVITDNLSSHDSKSTRAWLEDHPRIRHAFIPKGACWLNLQEGWWRIFRRQALAGQDFADPDLTRANRLVTCFEPLEDVAGGVGEVGVEGEALAVDLDGR